MMDEARIVASLKDPHAYTRAVAAAVDEVHHLETHISHLFFAGPRVFKVKKHIRLDFLDYGTLERRRRFCEEEVRLNRRLAPDVYLGAVPITRTKGNGLTVEGEGETVAWAVKMVRLPRDRMLENLLGEEGLDDDRIDAVVDRLVKFHAEADTGAGVDEHGGPGAVSEKVRDNLSGTEEYVDRGLLPEELHRFLLDTSESFLAEKRGLMERRVHEGRIREGHGDLHAGNICFAGSQSGSEGLSIYDCIEFSRRLRCGDVASDLAFLAMDLDRRGHARTSDVLVRRYAEKAGDTGLHDLIGFYKSYRAVVRAKVAALAAGDGETEEKHEEARGYFQLAASYALPASMTITCGVPVSGKSRLASRLAGALGAVVLRSDVTRKELAGVEPEDGVPENVGKGIYSESMTRRTYERLLERAVSFLNRGRNVIVDAAFPTRERRRPFAQAAAGGRFMLNVLHVTVPEALARDRLERRDAEGGGPSDAGPEVYRHMQLTFEPPSELDACVMPFESGSSDPLDLGRDLIARKIRGHRERIKVPYR